MSEFRLCFFFVLLTCAKILWLFSCNSHLYRIIKFGVDLLKSIINLTNNKTLELVHIRMMTGMQNTMSVNNILELFATGVNDIITTEQLIIEIWVGKISAYIMILVIIVPIKLKIETVSMSKLRPFTQISTKFKTNDRMEIIMEIIQILFKTTQSKRWEEFISKLKIFWF